MSGRTEDAVVQRLPDAEEESEQQRALEHVFQKVLELPQDVVLTEPGPPEGTDGTERPDQGDGQPDPRTVCPPAAETKWTAGAQCRAVWSEDGQVYPATVVSVDGGRCRVRFQGYGNEEEVELSALTSPDAALQTEMQDWRSGSRCRAVYSEDGLVYPAVVLWVKGQRCCVRFDDYNNEEEQDVSGLLSPDELRGPNRTAKGGSWRTSSVNLDWKRRRREGSLGERGGGRRPGLRDEQQSPSTVRDRSTNQSRDEKESEKKREAAEKPTNHSGRLFPPFPPPQLGDPLPFLPPPPPPVWTSGGKESGGSPGVDSMLMLWYMCGFHTGSYMTQQMFKSSSKD